MAVDPPRPSPPPPSQSLTRASSWTACAWQGRHMRAWARARAWSGKARASWARSYRTVGSRSSMRATGGAFSANLPPPPLRVRCPRARHTGWRPHLERAARVTHGAAPCTLMQCSSDASQCRCTRAVAHRGARCNPVHHHRDAPRCRCTQVVVHRGARCTTVHGGPRDDQIVSKNPSSTGLDFRV